MLKHTDLTGIFVATPTLMQDNGDIDQTANHTFVDYLISQEITGLVPLGGTGEYGSLSAADRLRFTEALIGHVAGRTPVVMGVLSTGYGDALDTVKSYGSMGADAAMVVTPYYTNPTQEGIFRYFHDLADASPIPILLYEIPYRTRISMSPEITARLSQHENIIGMKACNPDMYAFLKSVATVDETFSILSGEDTLFPLHVAAGARGGILATANIFPRVWQRILKHVKENDLSAALSVHRDLIPMIDLFFAETNPGPMKSIFDLLNIDAPGIRGPLSPASEDLRKTLRTLALSLRERYEVA